MTPRELPADFLHDPARTYRELRAEGPLHHVALPNGMRSWLVTDHAPARRALADPTLSKDAAEATALIARQAAERGQGGFVGELPRSMLNSDPPDHERLRSMVNREFTPRAVERMRPRIDQITTGLLDAMAQRAAAGEQVVDLLTTFAYPLPMTVICDLLGIPEPDRDRFRAWSDLIMSATGPDTDEIAGAADALMSYLARLVARRRDDPGDSMLDGLIAAAADDDRTTAGELATMAWLLLVAGYETTANLIGNGLLALLNHPDQLALVRADPSLLPDAVEELLRFDGPLNLATLRHTTAPWTVGDVTVPAGEFVAVSLLAANTDPAHHPDPDRLDVTRRTGHLAFGHGIHFCAGASLARLEAVIAFRELLARFPELALGCEPGRLTWRAGTLSHGLAELPIRLC